MRLSVFDLFKIGIGPSSSHTMGPMVAAGMFLSELREKTDRHSGQVRPAHLRCSLHGSLAFTGKGHATDRAVVLGLAGLSPEHADPDDCDRAERQIQETGVVNPPGLPPCRFKPQADIVFDYEESMPEHPNGLQFFAFGEDGEPVLSSAYYSIGGGFVRQAGAPADEPGDTHAIPFPFQNADDMLAMGEESGLSIGDMMRANETGRISGPVLDSGLDAIWTAMAGCIDRGLVNEGQLPGQLRVRRRAPKLWRDLKADAGRNDIPPHQVNDWLLLYAMAVNEENANGGRVVTAPTNGAAGVIPSVIRYALDHVPDGSQDRMRIMLLTAAAIGGIIKQNASISGAEVGCQGEVGSASAMAAAALAASLGGTNAQIENAAEIALEHHLGMTCDPVGGLVQIPCIERNGIGAVKAVAAASLALRGDGVHYVSLDKCIETMRQTGLDMSDKYKETSRGGLAVNVVAC